MKRLSEEELNKIKKSYSAEVLDLSTINPSESEIIAGNTYHFKNTVYRDWETDRKSTRLNSSHEIPSRMPSSA